MLLEKCFDITGHGMIRVGVSTVLLVLCALLGSIAAFDLPSHPLIEQAKRESGMRLNYALQNGARAELTADGRSFYLLWFPANRNNANPPPMIVTLHGHSSWASDEFYLWHKVAQNQGYGILAIQWWLGQGESIQDYLKPQEIYRIIDRVLTRETIGPQRVLFHGFSRGAANSYAVTAMDCSTGKDYFALIVANAGKSNSDYRPNREIEEGRFGQMPFKDTHWITFAGGKDPNPDRDGISGMRQVAKWIQRFGGIMDLAIEDESAGHGGFHQNPDNMLAAIKVFENRLRNR